MSGSNEWSYRKNETPSPGNEVWFIFVDHPDNITAITYNEHFAKVICKGMNIATEAANILFNKNHSTDHNG